MVECAASAGKIYTTMTITATSRNTTTEVTTMTKKTIEELKNQSYVQRLTDLQRRYLGLSKNITRPRRYGGAGGYMPGSEAEKVYLSGRY